MSARWSLRPLLRRAIGRPAERARGEPIVQLVRRAAALLRGGMASNRVWRVLLLESGHDPSGGGADDVVRGAPDDGVHRAPDDAVRAVAERIGAGDETADALAAGGLPGWRLLSAAWRLAESSGAPLAETLERLAHSMHELEQLAERRSVLLAAPRSTIRLVAALPPAALLLGALLGFDPWRTLADPISLASMVAGAVLLVLGVRWAAMLTRRAEDADRTVGWEFELAVIAIAGGAPPGVALRRAVECADLAQAEWVRLEELTRGGSVLGVFEAAESFGGPLASMLLSEAEARRSRSRAELERAAERLGIAVLVPLGVCVLPAFVLLAVVPVLIAVLSGASTV